VVVTHGANSQGRQNIGCGFRLLRDEVEDALKANADPIGAIAASRDLMFGQKQ
jgi:hypothetical protein